MPATLLASGALECQPQEEHTFCGHCHAPFLLCQCNFIPYANDYIIVGLPPPATRSTPQQLVHRWRSLLSMSMSMGALFDASLGWYKDNAQVLLASLQAKTPLLKELMQEYVQDLETDPAVPSLAKALSVHTKSKATQIRVVGAEARASMDIFLAGDWGCLTYIGSMLLLNAFQASDPQKYFLEDDEHLKEVFRNGVGLLRCLLGRGYGSWPGWHLALEMYRAPMTSGNAKKIESAAKRMESYRNM